MCARSCVSRADDVPSSAEEALLSEEICWTMDSSGEVPVTSSTAGDANTMSLKARRRDRLS